MNKAPERIYTNASGTAIITPPSFPLFETDIEWARADRIKELEAENKRLNEQMDVIEEMGTESLNALPDCLMRLAPALVENDELKAKLSKSEALLAKAMKALVRIADTPSEMTWGVDSEVREAMNEMETIAETTLAELTGGKDD